MYKSQKKSIKFFPLLTIFLSVTACGLAQSKNKQAGYDKTQIDSVFKSFDNILKSGKKEDSLSLRPKLISLLASDNENEWIMVRRYFFRLKDAKMVDSISAAQLAKFPNGDIARRKGADEIYAIKGGLAKENAYKEWIKSYPPAKFSTGNIDDNIIYDYKRAEIAATYAAENNVEKARSFTDSLAVDFWKGNAYRGVSQAFLGVDNLAQAEIYAKKEMELSYSYTDGKKGNSNATKFAASGYPGATSNYTDILFREKKYKEAYPYVKKAYESSKTTYPPINYQYAQILSSMGRDSLAFDILKEVVVIGKADSAMRVEFKELYSKVKGSDAGFDSYASSLRDTYLKNLKEDIEKKETNLPSVNFTLKDINGNSVSLSDFAGKVIILDFWATWCGPCKASFPAMQMAVNKFSKDPNVKFLFIHTWEHSETATQDATNYVKDHNYNFEVLMDLKDKETGTNKVVSSYKVNGIPAKFVIDTKGKIRFQLTGFDGSNEAAVEELSLMIEKAKG